MFQHCWLSLVVIVHFLFFVVTAAPHTVHHGLHDGDSQECPVSTVTTQASGDVPDILPLPTPLPLTYALPTFDLILPEKLACEAHRSRAPPLNFPV